MIANGNLVCEDFDVVLSERLRDGNLERTSVSIAEQIRDSNCQRSQLVCRYLPHRRPYNPAGEVVSEF
jgi:hypothetical protein